MNIEDAVGESFYEVGREEAHVAGQADKIDFVFVENGHNLAIEGFALQTFRWEDASGQAAGFGAVDTGSSFAIADDHGDSCVGDTAGRDAISESFEVRAATA